MAATSEEEKNGKGIVYIFGSQNNFTIQTDVLLTAASAIASTNENEQKGNWGIMKMRKISFALLLLKQNYPGLAMEPTQRKARR